MTVLRDLTRVRPCPIIANVFYVRIEKADEPGPVRSTTPWMPPPFAGNPDAIIEHLDAFRQACLEYALCGFESEDLNDLLRQMRLFAEEVAPQLAGVG